MTPLAHETTESAGAKTAEPEAEDLNATGPNMPAKGNTFPTATNSLANGMAERKCPMVPYEPGYSPSKPLLLPDAKARECTRNHPVVVASRLSLAAYRETGIRCMAPIPDESISPKLCHGTLALVTAYRAKDAGTTMAEHHN